ncbi:uncharacterized protein N7484_001006 [Penicillium longicatenatum]|uniref:uncharacterized protein n=1 Tax=Penicillium longicatenatum TaxID=1561947 RepID=UPI0025498456|nr:uncharacterized protein N7484_001006 [Penicillium longicatenatum]KAJ5657357.1 hypothetical protein N7484_001006 [Penicillium longicatenatum]
MSDHTSPPNSYELYHGQAQGQGYYPSHQESTMPEQKYYNSARSNTPGLNPGSEYLPRVSNQDNGYVPYHAEQHLCSGENASYYAGIPQDQVNGVGTVPGVGPEGDGGMRRGGMLSSLGKGLQKGTGICITGMGVDVVEDEALCADGGVVVDIKDISRS